MRQVLSVRLFAATFLAATLAAAQPPDVTVRKLSPAGSGTTDVAPEGHRREISPDGNWILFWSDADTNNVYDLYSVNRFGGSPHLLSALRPAGGEAFGNLSITPDSRRVVYQLDQETLGRWEIWSVPIQGPVTEAVKLSPSLPADVEYSGATLSEDGARVHFWGRPIAGGPYELWSAPVDGSAPAIRLHGDLPEGADGLSQTSRVGAGIVFKSDLATAGRDEIWYVPVDGSAAPIRLNGTLAAGGQVLDYSSSDDGTRIVYLADQRFNDVVELFSVPTTGPFAAGVRLSPDLVAMGDVDDFRFSADDSRVLFLGDVTTFDKIELWSVPVAGPSTSAVKLNSALNSTGDVTAHSDGLGGSVAYIADPSADEVFNAYLVPIAGPSSSAFQLNDPVVAGGDVGNAGTIDSNGTIIAFFTGDTRVNGTTDLFTTPLDPPADPHPLFGEDPPAGNQLPCSSSYATPLTIVFCSDLVSVGNVRLWEVGLDLVSTPIQLDDGFVVANSDVTDVIASAQSDWIYFRSDRGFDERYDLYRVPAGGASVPVRLHAVPIPGGGDVVSPDGFTVTDDGQGVFYVADHATHDKFELCIADRILFRANFESADTSEWSATSP